jgi:general stress protein 26
MTSELSSETVWKELEGELFAVLGMVTAKGKARTIGVVYIVHDRNIYVLTGEDTWKARHIRGNPNVSLTVPIPKRIPFLPWIKIPAATISFSGKALLVDAEKVDKEILHKLMRGQEDDLENLGTLSVIKINPSGDFVTYGVGIPLMTMREPEKARGRAPVA